MDASQLATLFRKSQGGKFANVPDDVLVKTIIKHDSSGEYAKLLSTPKTAANEMMQSPISIPGGIGGEPAVTLPVSSEQVGKFISSPTTLATAASLGAAAVSPGLAIPNLARIFGPRIAAGAASAALQAGAAGGASLLSQAISPGSISPEKALSDVEFAAGIDAGLSGAGAGIRIGAKAASPYIKKAIGSISHAVSMAKVPYNSVRLWFRNPEGISKIVEKGGERAKEIIKNTADKMYPAIDGVDKTAQESFKKLQNQANNYHKLVGKAVGAADKRLEKMAISANIPSNSIGSEAVDMLKESSKTVELKNAYADQISEVTDWLKKWNEEANAIGQVGIKRVTELIGAKKALDVRLDSFYAKYPGLSRGSADLVERAFSSIRGDIDGKLAEIAGKVGFKRYKDVYKRASEYYKFYGNDLGSLIDVNNEAAKTVVDKINVLSSYIENKPGGWAAFEGTMQKAPKVLQKGLNNMMDTLAARRALQAAAGSPSGIFMGILRAGALSPQNTFRLVKLSNRILETLEGEERTAFSKMIEAAGLGYKQSLQNPQK